MIGRNIRDAQENEFPYVVSVMRMRIFNADPIRDHSCTGTLISRKDIVTAEHCVEAEDLLATKIVVGSNNLRECESYFIFWWTTYKHWAMRSNIPIEFYMNDVAVIRVS
jgi:V8-like Glu-specific endopeptidase